MSRVRAEIQRWRAAWQQVETLLDRIDGAREEDAPEALRTNAAYKAISALESLRGVEFGVRLEERVAPRERTTAVTIAQSGGELLSAYQDRTDALPGALEIEAALAGLDVDDDGKPEDPPMALLLESGPLFTVVDDDGAESVLQAPVYSFGPLRLQGSAGAWPGLANFVKSRHAKVAIAEGDGEDVGSDDAGRESYFPLDRREAAAAEGFVELLGARAVYEARRAGLVAGPSPTLSEMSSLAQSDPETARFALALVDTVFGDALDDLDDAARVIEEDDPGDPLVAAIDALHSEVSVARRRWAELKDALQDLHAGVQGAQASVNYRRNRVRVIFEGAELGPRRTACRDALEAVLDGYDEAIALRIAYPDGGLRSLRTLEVALLRLWRFRAPWFAQRRRLVLDPWLGRFLDRFALNLAGVVGSGQSLLGTEMSGVVPEGVVATTATTITVPEGVRPNRVRPGEVATVGGSRPALLRLLGPDLVASDRVRISPARVSLASGPDLPGVAGVLDPQAALGRSTTVVPGAHLVRGTHPDGPASEAISHQIVAWWGELALVRGKSALGFSLPSPFDAGLSVNVYAHVDYALSARTAQLVLVDPPRDADGLLVATPGEVMLLRGQDADGDWWQGVIEVQSASLTTLDALGLPPLDGADDDPCCVMCSPADPVALVTLSANSVDVELESTITVHRDFRGFGNPSLAVGVLLPEEVDPVTQTLKRTTSGAFSTSGTGAVLRREPELQAAALLVERWVPSR